MTTSSQNASSRQHAANLHYPIEASVDNLIDVQDFAAWLASHRNAAKLTQSDAAGRAHISANHWYRLEKGVCRPRRDTLLRLAHAVGADVDEALRIAGAWLPDVSHSEHSPYEQHWHKVHKSMKKHSHLLREIRDLLQHH